MKYHTTTADMLELAAIEGCAVGEIPEGMDPVGALVIVLTRRGDGKADGIEVGTITADDIYGTGPFIIFKKSGLLLGAGFTPEVGEKAILDMTEEEELRAAETAKSPFAKSAKSAKSA
jgi:hypothetical protein